MNTNTTKPSIAVIMSTYNGEKYLREQLDSILNQKDVNLDLYVRDDGSVDGTAEILNQYSKRYPQVHVDLAANAGVGNSFMNCLYSVPGEYQYYGFADQDDIWLQDKCIAGISALKRTGKALYSSNQECVDSDGKSRGLRYTGNDHIHLTTMEIVFRNTIAGCTFIFTNELAEKLRSNPFSSELLRVRIHDVCVAAAASMNGGIFYDQESHMEYRQHQNNVVGVKEDTFKSDLKTKLSKAVNSEQRNGRSRLAYELVKLYPEQAQNDQLLMLCADQKSMVNRIKLIRRYGEISGWTSETFSGFAGKVLFGLF